jgi:hypothetical protein
VIFMNSTHTLRNGFASQDARTGRFHLVTTNGLDLVQDAGSLAEAEAALDAHEAWVRNR